MASTKKRDLFFDQLLSDPTKRKSERVILLIAIASFLIHLALIYAVDLGFISLNSDSNLLRNPIAAIYTPFSFILVYEVYLLIYYLPQSITTYITKQYEIISLIIIRRLFKDFSSLSLSSDWFKEKYDLQFTYDLIASVLLFFLIYQFYVQGKKKYRNENLDDHQAVSLARFIKIKKLIAASLVPILIAVAIYSFVTWLKSSLGPGLHTITDFKNINNIFFEQFFTILIIADVILLLISFFNTDEFHKVIRNSGFIISTILIRISFSVSGILNDVLILAATLFGLLILIIHNLFEKHLANEKNASSSITGN